jgi:Abortive infection alpha
MSDEHSNGLNGSLIRAAPGLVRIAAAAAWRTAGWTLETSARVGSRVVEAAASGESTTELLRSAGTDARDYVRQLLGLSETPPSRPAPGAEASQNGAGSPLRERGAELLRKSADVNFDEDAHPAYDRILDELAPDEGRILRLLATRGPQPAVDVRSGLIPLTATSDLVAPGLNMIGAEAGCRHLERLPAYLNNLNRLGLIWFSREALEDPLAYQVLEAQPEVVEALKQGRTRTVRRSIHLTPFGEDFCKTVLPLETAELDALPGDQVRQPEP